MVLHFGEAPFLIPQKTGKYLLCFLCCRLVHTALIAIDTTSAEILLLLTGIDGVAHTADFHSLFLHRARNLKDGPARRAGCFGVFEHFWVDSGLHSRGIVLII